MKKIFLVLAVALAMAGFKFTYTPASAAEIAVCQTIGMSAWMLQVNEAMKETPLDLVVMEGTALEKFFVVINEMISNNGGTTIKPGEVTTLVWAVLPGKEKVGVAYFKDGCYLEAFQVDIKMWADIMEQAFGQGA
jgi:hypothetical protein